MPDMLKQNETRIEPRETASMGQFQLAKDVEPLFVKAGPRLQRIARLRGIDADSADDVVQETFIEAWRHLEQLRSPERLDAWLDGICRNVCRRHQRQHGMVQAKEVSFADITHAESNDGAEMYGDLRDGDTFDPAAELERHDMAVLLERALRHLPVPTRDIVELCYLAELPQAEAAARLGVTISSLEARLHRARKQLRQVLSGALRAEAESFGLALDPAAMGQWRESRDWCLICGKSRLWGIFAPMPDGRIDFRMRCPACRIGEIFCSKGLVDFKGTYSFRPAMKRLVPAFSTFYGDALRHDGRALCWNCHQPVRLGIEHGAVESLPQYQMWMGWKCRCGPSYSAGVVVCLNEPSVFSFLARSHRCIIESDKLVTFQGASAARFTLHDLVNGRRMLIFAHPQTLVVLATIIE